ncbi:alpha/beta hydrolase [Pseudanabaena sp. FACHB-2040]|uniref:alpha/beta fold hydrolase n=1 Tax=Pseudanabaena sp. FACHB-2040 TaxID=2692859 RepID=UPI001689A151|nr:alpha/beta hydrolase [Pseudanabaena sp. FACHB-2040]MBD2256802.1 alpha/beta hydrolase [Pseudanabaena sp. FACHB-2040]
MVPPPEKAGSLQSSRAFTISAFEEIKQIEKSLKEIYFISGLGADERVFRLLKFEGYRPVHLGWLEPQPSEPIEAYAQRLAAQIKTSKPVIIGLSFGGMIAVEIAKQIPVEKVILLSSVKDRYEVPPYYRIFRWLPIHRIFPFKSVLWAICWFAYWVFGVSVPDERKLLKTILLETDPHFLKWALHRVVLWQNEEIPEDVTHIHGSCDRIFPTLFVEPDFMLPNGGHLMVMHQAREVSALLEKVIG